MEKQTLENMSLELASQIIEGVKKAQKNQTMPPLNIAIMDNSGMLTAFNRQDGSLKGSLDVSMLKANSSALFQLTTRQIKTLAFGDEDTPPLDPGMTAIPGVLAVPGGVPIFNSGGKIIGAVGVSGADDDSDERCALAGINYAKRDFELN